VKWGVFKDGRVGTGWWSRRRPKPKDKARTESTQRWGPAPVNPRRRQPLNEWKLSLNAAEIDDALDAGPAAHSESHSDCRRRTVECPFYIVRQSVSQLIGGVVVSLPLLSFPFPSFLALLNQHFVILTANTWPRLTPHYFWSFPEMLLKCGQVKNLHTQPKRPKKGKPSIYIYIGNANASLLHIWPHHWAIKLPQWWGTAIFSASLNVNFHFHFSFCIVFSLHS